MQGLKKSLLVSIWFMFLTFPLMVIRVNTIENTVEWRWINLAWIGLGSFALSFVWRYFLRKRELGAKKKEHETSEGASLLDKMTSDKRFALPTAVVLAAAAIGFPWLVSTYNVNIMISALIYIVLGLGLNIVVGLAGLLDLGYVSFYAVGAYSYALLNHHFGITFWQALPIGGALAAVFGLILGFPVLRLRGDYLAIVTLGFSQIIRLVLENWGEFSFGPSGIANIERPSLFGIGMNLDQVTTYIYYLVVVMVLITIFVVNRLKNSRIGRALLALREDEIACQAMGIDKMNTKLMAFAMGATWAGFAGVIFAAKTTFINPASFTFMESAIILSIVVLGGMGSIVGIILASFVLMLMPEYLRAFSEYRMLIFGAAMVVMMVFRPQGLVTAKRKHYTIKDMDAVAAEEAR